jgi:hypothetical protein
MALQVEGFAAEREAFERDGFVIFDPRISEQTIDRAVAEAGAQFQKPSLWDRLRGRPAPSIPPQPRYTDAWATSRTVRDIALAPRSVDLLRTLYGRKPRPFQTLNFCVGTQQATHSDAVHFNTDPPGFMCAVWVALEDIDMDNGPLVYYPGSHKLPEVRPSDVGIDIEPGAQSVSDEAYHAAYEPYIERLIKERGLQPEYGLLRKGQALLWATNLLHGGMPVRQPGRTRHSQVTHYYFEGTRLWTPLLTAGDAIAWREAPGIR